MAGSRNAVIAPAYSYLQFAECLKLHFTAFLGLIAFRQGWSPLVPCQSSCNAKLDFDSVLRRIRADPSVIDLSAFASETHLCGDDRFDEWLVTLRKDVPEFSVVFRAGTVKMAQRFYGEPAVGIGFTIRDG